MRSTSCLHSCWLVQSAKQFLSIHHMRFRFVWILLTEMYEVNKLLAFVLVGAKCKTVPVHSPHEIQICLDLAYRNV